MLDGQYALLPHVWKSQRKPPAMANSRHNTLDKFASCALVNSTMFYLHIQEIFIIAIQQNLADNKYNIHTIYV